MSNINYEQQLIEEYLKISNLKNIEVINKNCKSKKHSDLEYIDKSEQYHWRIEAKSHMSKDAYNAVHKIFGELLKETGRPPISDKKIKYGILLDGSYCSDKKITGKEFFRKYFRHIEIEKYKKFGLLIPVDVVIVCDPKRNKVENFTWNQFIGAE